MLMFHLIIGIQQEGHDLSEDCEPLEETVSVTVQENGVPECIQIIKPENLEHESLQLEDVRHYDS